MIIRKAALIDDLSEDLPNPSLINGMSKILKSARYEVTVFNGSMANVELFKNLLKMSFKLIIIETPWW